MVPEMSVIVTWLVVPVFEGSWVKVEGKRMWIAVAMPVPLGMALDVVN